MTNLKGESTERELSGTHSSKGSKNGSDSEVMFPNHSLGPSKRLSGSRDVSDPCCCGRGAMEVTNGLLVCAEWSNGDLMDLPHLFQPGLKLVQVPECDHARLSVGDPHHHCRLEEERGRRRRRRRKMRRRESKTAPNILTSPLSYTSFLLNVCEREEREREREREREQGSNNNNISQHFQTLVSLTNGLLSLLLITVPSWSIMAILSSSEPSMSSGGG